MTPTDTSRPASTPSGRRMRVVRRDELVARFDAVVREVLDREALALPPAGRRAVRLSLGETLNKMLAQRGRQVRGMTRAQFLVRLSESHDRMLEERLCIRAEIEGLQHQLGSMRTEAGLAPVDLEQQIKQRLEASGLARCLSTGLTQDVLEFASNTVREFSGPAAGADPKETDLLRRRVAKMTTEIANLEVALEHMLRAKNVDPGVASIYECVQGLTQLDQLYEQKSEMLRDVFEANQALRKELVAKGSGLAAKP